MITLRDKDGITHKLATTRFAEHEPCARQKQSFGRIVGGRIRRRYPPRELTPALLLNPLA